MSTDLNESQLRPSPRTVDMPPPGAGEISRPDVPAIPVRVSRAERKAATRKRILKTAREVFFRDGFMDTSLDEVASRANIGKGTLYRHFESKAELYVAVLLANGTFFEEQMHDAIDPGAPAIEQLRTLGEFYREFWSSRANYFKIFWAVENQPTIGDLPATLLERVKEIWERPLRRVEAIIQKGIDEGEIRECDPWVTANVLWSVGNSCFEAMSAPSGSRLIECQADEIYRTGLDTVLRGLEAR